MLRYLRFFRCNCVLNALAINLNDDDDDDTLTQQHPRRITCGRCTNVTKSNDPPAFPPPYAPPTFILYQHSISFNSAQRTTNRLLIHANKKIYRFDLPNQIFAWSIVNKRLRNCTMLMIVDTLYQNRLINKSIENAPIPNYMHKIIIGSFTLEHKKFNGKCGSGPKIKNPK